MSKVFINPGHAPYGNPDPGACGNGLRESDVTAAVGALVQKYLNDAGVETNLLQSDSLGEISATSNAWGADLFVSIHCNSAGNPAANGTETFRYNGSVKGAKLAGAIQKQLVDSIGTTDRGVKDANFYVLRNTDCVAVLVELAFISNEGDAAILRDKQDDIARAIARGVTDYIIDGGAVQPPAVAHAAPEIDPASGMLSEHFAANEFACHCCGQGGGDMHPRLIELLEQLRANIGGYPLHINSAYRCPSHNAEVGGVPNSQHVLHTAADVARPDELSFDEFAWYVGQLPFDGIGLYPGDMGDFVHTDVRHGGVGSHIYW